MATPGSPHGYDVTNPRRMNPEIGTIDDFRLFSRRLHQLGMGVIVDVVPNHMAIGDPTNEWWWDVLENGPGSRFARYFDIDWHPPKADLANKVLCPILGDQYGRVLEDQQITVIYRDGRFCISVYDRTLPLSPDTWRFVLQPAIERLKDRLGGDRNEAGQIEALLGSLSGDREILKERLAVLMAESEESRRAIDCSLREINGTIGVPSSFNRLEDLLSRQFYRLCDWRVASDEINYRRFFDVNNLAAIRVEDPEVFQAVHALIFRLIGERTIDGLRVDHPDGLLDPSAYFRALRDRSTSAAGASRPFYIVSEKILAGDEALRRDWDIEGTTGYDFLGVVNGLFVDRRGHRAFQHLYESFTGDSNSGTDLVYGCKKLILQTSLASELNLLTNKLDAISARHRYSRDFTRSSLRHVLRETIACFPIYRTYTQEEAISADREDERYIRLAVILAKRRNPSTSESIFDFLESLLLLEDPAGIDAAQRLERRRFVLSFQQFTGPLMAKGLEDTAFFRYTPLASLNEVGARFRQFGVATSEFHDLNLRHAASWPHTMTSTSTHDSKRSEDVRARLNVLSEIPAEWDRAIRRWRGLNAKHKTESEGGCAPSAAEEYLFYQDLAGVWPMVEPTPPEYDELRRRMQAHIRKSLREAKLHTSWVNPNVPYERAVDGFVQAVLEPVESNRFLCEFREFVKTLFAAGIWNSLSQTMLKIGSPGVPDFYQGSEAWNLSLVDPDNRRPVDFVRRVRLLRELAELERRDHGALIQQLMRSPSGDALKLYVTSRALGFRKSRHKLFSEGHYLPLRCAGDRQRHVVGFARALDRSCAIVVVGRHFISLGARARPPLGEEIWRDSVLVLRKELPRTRYRNVFTRETVEVEARSGKRVLPLAMVFDQFPVALLAGEDSW